MKRHAHGMNLDEGLPLTSEQEFNLLQVICQLDTRERLIHWLREPEDLLIIGGQIGSGKSTLIAGVFFETEVRPDITLRFDVGSLNLDIGDFLAILIEGFICKAIELNLDLSRIKNLPYELGGYRGNDWSGLIEGFSPKEVSAKAYEKKLMLRQNIVELSKHGYLQEVILWIGDQLEHHLGRKIFIFASGLDKFELDKPSFVYIKDDIASILKNYKTLFEMNAVHLFANLGTNFASSERLFIPYYDNQTIVEILAKRMGVYSQGVTEELYILAEWSGGNPRQAVRLLHYYKSLMSTKGRLNALEHAFRACATDFFAATQKPSADLIRVVLQNGYLETGMIAHPGNLDTVRTAVYGNWILLGNATKDLKRSAKINPLVKSVFMEKDEPIQPEEFLLKKYAESAGISDFGLGVNRIDERTGQAKSGEQMLRELLSSGVEELHQTSLEELLEILRGTLLTKDKQGRYIIAYRNQEVANAVKAYLHAKSNTYEKQLWADFTLDASNPIPATEQLRLARLNPDHIISLEFTGDWDRKQLELLDKHRDNFIQFEMIWWIQYDKLKQYLPYWTHLRQFFEVLLIEDELLREFKRRRY